MLNVTLERLDSEDYDYFRRNFSHCRIGSDIGFIAEAYDYRHCTITGENEDALNAFFSIETPQGRRCFTINENAGLTEAEFKAVTRQDIENIDRSLPPL